MPCECPFHWDHCKMQSVLIKLPFYLECLFCISTFLPSRNILWIPGVNGTNTQFCLGRTRKKKNFTFCFLDQLLNCKTERCARYLIFICKFQKYVLKEHPVVVSYAHPWKILSAVENCLQLNTLLCFFFSFSFTKLRILVSFFKIPGKSDTLYNPVLHLTPVVCNSLIPVK